MAEGAIGKLQFRSRNSKAFSVGRSKMTMWNMDLYQFRKVVRLLRRQPKQTKFVIDAVDHFFGSMCRLNNFLLFYM